MYRNLKRGRERDCARTTMTISLLGILFLSCFSAGAQDKVWSLQECIEYARDHNIQIKQQELQKNRAEVNFQQSRLSQLPTVNGTATYGKNFGRSIDPTTNLFVGDQLTSAGGDLSAGLTLFNFFRVRNTIKANKQQLRASDAILDQMMGDIALNVSNAFLQILLADEQVKVSKEQIKLTLSQLENTMKQVNTGVLPESNKIDIEAQLAKDSALLIDNTNQYRSAILQMKTLLNLDFEEGFVAEPLNLGQIGVLNIMAVGPEDIYQSALLKHPVVRADSLNILASKSFLKAAQSLLLPTLSFGAQIGTNYSSAFQRPIGETMVEVPPSPIGNVELNGESYVVHSLPQEVSQPLFEDPKFRSQLKDNVRENIGLSLSIPLFNGWQSRAQIRTAEIDLEAQKLARDQDLLNLKQDIYLAYADAKAALENYNAAKKTLRSVETSFYYAEKRYEAGVFNSFEYLSSQNELFNARTGLISKHYDYLFKVKVLEFYQKLNISLK